MVQKQRAIWHLSKYRKNGNRKLELRREVGERERERERESDVGERESHSDSKWQEWEGKEKKSGK